MPITFEDDTLDQSDEVGENENTSWDFWTLRIDVQDEYLPLAERDDAVEGCGSWQRVAMFMRNTSWESCIWMAAL